MPGDAPLRVLRFTSVFEPSAAADTRGAGGGALLAPYDPVGGMQNHTAELTRCLDRRGFEQTVLTSRLSGPAGPRRLGGSAVVVRTGVRVPVLRQLWAPPALALALRSGGDRHADVVHAHAGEDLAVLPVARLAALRHGCPLVITLHCSLRHTLRGRDPRSLLLRSLGGAVERRVAACADAVITLTPAAARRLGDDDPCPKGRVHVIPSGFAPELFAGPYDDPFPGLPHPRIAYVGRLARQKDVGTLLEAFARLGPRRASLVVVGDGPQRAALQRRADELGVPARFTGFVRHERVPAVLGHVDVFVLPSRYEELGSVLVEAMAAGVPVVASRVGGIPHLVRDGETGLLAAAGDTASFAHAVARLLDEPETAARLGRTARRTVATAYAWPVLAGRVAEVYRQVIDGRGTDEHRTDERRSGGRGIGGGPVDRPLPERRIGRSTP